MLAPLAAPATVTIYRRARSGTDRNGNDTWSETAIPVEGCAWWPGSAGRNVAGSREYGAEDWRTQVATRAQVLFPDGTTIDPDDQVALADVPGERWHVRGDGMQWRSQLTGSVTGIQVEVERVDG